MSSLDALFGRVYASGTELELGGGIDFKTGLTAVYNPSTKRIDVTASGGGGGGGHTIENNGTPLTQRTSLNFVGAGVTVADSGGKTTVTIPGGTTYSAGSGLNLTGSTFSIPVGAVTNTMLAGSIADAKLASTFVNVNGTVPLSAAWDVGNQAIDDVRRISYDGEINNATSTIDLSTGAYQAKTLSANTTLVFSNPTPFSPFQIRLVQDTTPRTITWPVGVLWDGGGSGPAMPTGSGAELIVSGYYDGTSYRMAGGPLPVSSLAPSGTDGRVLATIGGVPTWGTSLGNNTDAFVGNGSSVSFQVAGSQRLLLSSTELKVLLGATEVLASFTTGLSAGETFLDSPSAGIRIRPGGVPRLIVGSAGIIVVGVGMQFEGTQTDPTIDQQATNTNGATGKKLFIKAQTCTGTTSTGGALDIAPGAGTTAGGLGRLMSGSGSARVQWNDTGVGFYATAPVAKPTVTGSRGGNAALASLLTALASLGLITDSTTA